MVQTGIFNGRTRVRYGYARWGWTRGGGKTWHGGIVLEGAGRAVPQLERIQAVADLNGLARLAAKGSAVGRCRCGVQEISAVIGQKTGQDLLGQLGIGEIFPCVQIGPGEGLRHEQTALRCQTADDSLLCGNAECGISGAQILHTFTPFLLFSFLYMYKPFLALYRCCERRIAGGYGIRPYGWQVHCIPGAFEC